MKTTHTQTSEGITQSPLDNSTKLATTGYADAADLSATAALIEREGLRFDGTAGAVISNGGIPAVGTGDFTFLCEVSVDTLTGAKWLVGKSTPSSSFGLQILNATLQATNITVADLTSSGFSLSAGVSYIVGYSRSGTIGTYYVNANPVAVVVDNQNYANASDSIGIVLTSGLIGKQAATRFFNYALTTAEIAALTRRGLVTLPEQKDGSMTSLLTGDSSTFTSGLGSWTAQSAGVVTNTAGKLVITNCGSSYNGAHSGITVVKGRRYKLVITLSSIVGGIGFDVGNIGDVTGPELLFSDSALTTSVPRLINGINTVYYTAKATGALFFCGIWTSSATTSVTFDDVTLFPLGTLFEQDSGQRNAGYMVRDTSGNGCDLILPASGVSIIDPAKGGTINFTTNTNGNQQLGGSQVIIPTNARITSWVINSTGTPTISLGNVSGGAQFVSALSLAATAYNDVTLLTRFCTTGNLWCNSNSTDTLKHTIQWEYIQA